MSSKALGFNGLIFDYEALDASVRIELRIHTDCIQKAMKRTVEDIVEIGCRLTQAKAILDHGQFEEWIKVQLGLGKSTAENYMKVHARFGNEILNNSGFAVAPTVLYELAKPSFPGQEVQTLLTGEAQVKTSGGNKPIDQVTVEELKQHKRDLLAKEEQKLCLETLSEQIKDLESKLDQIGKERDEYKAALSQASAKMEGLKNKGPLPALKKTFFENRTRIDVTMDGGLTHVVRQLNNLHKDDEGLSATVSTWLENLESKCKTLRNELNTIEASGEIQSPAEVGHAAQLQIGEKKKFIHVKRLS